MIQCINLSNNNLNDISVFSSQYMPHLIELNLSNNLITSTLALKSYSISKLYLSRNKINMIDLHACPKIKYLDLSYNNLNTFNLKSNEQIVELNLSNNNFDQI